MNLVASNLLRATIHYLNYIPFKLCYNIFNKYHKICLTTLFNVLRVTYKKIGIQFKIEGDYTNKNLSPTTISNK